MLLILSRHVEHSCSHVAGLNSLFTLGGQQKYLIMPANMILPTVSDIMTCSLVITWHSQQQLSSYSKYQTTAQGRSFLLQPLGVEQIFHTRWPTGIFAHSCIRGQTYINSPLWTSPPAAIIDSCHVLRQPKAFCFRAAYHNVRVWRSWEQNSARWS